MAFKDEVEAKRAEELSRKLGITDAMDSFMKVQDMLMALVGDQEEFETALRIIMIHADNMAMDTVSILTLAADGIPEAVELATMMFPEVMKRDKEKPPVVKPQGPLRMN